MGAMKDMLIQEAEIWERIIRHRLVRMPRHWYDYRGNLSSLTPEWIMERLLNPLGNDRFDEMEITLSECNDYGGSSLDRANVRVWRDEYSTEAYEDWGAWSESKAWLVLGIVPGADPDDPADRLERLTAIAEALDSLDDYPLLSEEAHSELEMELAEEAWDSWLWQDIRSDVDSVIEERWGDDWENAPDASEYEERIREAYYCHDDTWWSCETANSAVNSNHDRVLADVLEDVLKDVYPTE